MEVNMLIPSNLVNELFDDRYFDVVNALDEAQQIYFRNNNLIERVLMGIDAKTPLIIGETGFGAGRVVVSFMEVLKDSAAKTALRAAGFSINKLPGCGGKNEVLLGVKC
jgi:tRNA 5-methylaminomethyl-2-thiouridine biosynthesis bifunctional protein